MLVQVKYFAVVRERLGLGEETLNLPAEATVDQLWSELLSRHALLAGLKAHLRIAVNLEFATDGQVLREDDVVAVIPPVAGGSDCARLTQGPLDVNALTDRARSDSCGAVVSFLGTIRDFSAERPVNYLEYEAYPAMALAKLEQIAGEIRDRWPDCRVLVEHRLGRIEVGQAAIAIAVAAPHRRHAFAACEYMIDRIKAVVPIWKREVGPDGAAWIGLGS